MFHPEIPERKRDERSKEEILKEMKNFCSHYNIKPIKVFDCIDGIYFVFPLPNQKLTEEEIWDSKGMREIKEHFSKKEYFIMMKKWYYNTSFLNDFKIGKEKIHLFIGMEDVKDFLEIVKNREKEIDFQ
jgi:hypothetical protein